MCDCELRIWKGHS